MDEIPISGRFNFLYDKCDSKRVRECGRRFCPRMELKVKPKDRHKYCPRVNVGVNTFHTAFGEITIELEARASTVDQIHV
jgi:hypothetical protein